MRAYLRPSAQGHWKRRSLPHDLTIHRYFRSAHVRGNEEGAEHGTTRGCPWLSSSGVPCSRSAAVSVWGASSVWSSHGLRVLAKDEVVHHLLEVPSVAILVVLEEEVASVDVQLP